MSAPSCPWKNESPAHHALAGVLRLVVSKKNVRNCVMRGVVWVRSTADRAKSSAPSCQPAALAAKRSQCAPVPPLPPFRIAARIADLRTGARPLINFFFACLATRPVSPGSGPGQAPGSRPVPPRITSGAGFRIRSGAGFRIRSGAGFLPENPRSSATTAPPAAA